jgi:hypothetical protein
MSRYAANIRSNFERPAPVRFGEGETGFAAQRQWARSSFELVADDILSAPLGLPAHSREVPHPPHYLFNSMPCAYAWFYH